MVPTRIVSGLLALTVLFGLVGCTSNQPAGQVTEPQSQAPEAPALLPDPDVKIGQTAIRLDITDCDGCQVKLQSAPKGALDWESPWYSVEIGSQWIVMPTLHTRGLSIALTTPAAPLPAEQQYNVVFNYEGQTVFDQVDPGRVGTDFTRGFGCWIGTTDRKVALPIQVNYVKNDAGRVVAQVYTQFGANPFGTLVDTPNGSLISTGFFPCGG